MPDRYTVAVVGAGLVGEYLISELRRREFPMKELRVFARSARRATLAGEEFEVGVAEPESFEGVDYALFAGAEGDKGAGAQLAREAAARGTIVVDNGSDFRLDPEVPLVVPEVNVETLRDHKGIVANPNCSTTQMVATLAPIARRFGLRKVIVSTYQAVSGAGREAVEALESRREDAPSETISGNAVPFIGDLEENGYTKEEKKMREESRKILSTPDLPIFPTAVRVPVHTGHSESIHVETEKHAALPDVLEVFEEASGIVFSGDAAEFPTPLEAAGEPGIYLGRVRVDEGRENSSVEYWCVTDNLLKGAATNAVQIMESLVSTTN